MSSVDSLVLKLNHCKEVKPRRDHKRSWIAQCPAHDDSSPSLNIDEGDQGVILLKCWAGCGAEEIIDSVGMGMVDLFPDDGYECRIKRIVKDACFHELLLEISAGRRERGEKQSKSDKEAEMQSYMALRGRQ